MNLIPYIDFSPNVLKSEKARRNFFYYCQLLAPDFYKDDRPHLIEICNTLQNLYEGKLLKDGKPVKKLMINMPPQHGKSRTLINFSMWVFGRNPKEKIITASYNDLTASDFSRYTRDGINTTKNKPDEIVYSDIFPKTRIKQGNAGHERWALEGQHFSYIGAGVGGSITSKGGTILMIDDPIKGAAEALNENELDKIWLWYTSTFLSRVSAEGGEPIEIINMTRWSKRDLCGRILEDERNAKEWYILKMEAYDKQNKTMLCPSLLSYNRYETLKRNMDEGVFDANYHQEPLDIKGVLLPLNELQYYKPSELHKDSFETSLGYCDIADEGSDSLACPIGRNIKDKVHITDVVFTKENADVSMGLVADLIRREQTQYCRVESNSMGAMFGRNLQKQLNSCNILLFNSTTNKHTRILLEAGFIKRHFVFVHPDFQTEQYRRFMKEVGLYLKESKKQPKDDAIDSLTGLAIFIRAMLAHLYE